MISMDKKYKTKTGIPVRILCVDGPVKDFPIIGVCGEWVQSWDIHGVSQYKNSNIELVEVSEWDDFKIDDKVMVCDNGKSWLKRYFAGVSSDGQPMAFSEGTTSWTSTSHPYAWEYCRKPTEEELK